MTDDDYGKVRVFICICGAKCVRPLYGDVKPCDHCLRLIDWLPYAVEDHQRFVDDLLRAAKEN